jgi:hypothetical protein
MAGNTRPGLAGSGAAPDATVSVARPLVRAAATSKLSPQASPAYTPLTDHVCTTARLAVGVSSGGGGTRCCADALAGAGGAAPAAGAIDEPDELSAHDELTASVDAAAAEPSHSLLELLQRAIADSMSPPWPRGELARARRGVGERVRGDSARGREWRAQGRHPRG